MKPKSKGAGIMVSDFIDEKHGFLALTQEEYDRAKVTDSSFWMHARVYLEYREAKGGYWNSERFTYQMKMVVRIAEVKYPKAEGWKRVWIFDHSSCHGAKAHDALDVFRMNVSAGGKQRVMRDGWWVGKSHPMNSHVWSSERPPHNLGRMGCQYTWPTAGCNEKSSWQPS